MKCFLLAAGMGIRLRPITDKIPKCLLPIDGKPILEIWLKLLAENGVKQVLINTHWLNQKVEKFSRSIKGTIPEIILYKEPVLLGSAGTLWYNRSWINDDEPFFIIYADTLTNVDLTKMLAFHNQHKEIFTLGVFRTDSPQQCGIVELSENNLVIGFIEKPVHPTSNIAAAGVYLADKRIFKFFPKVDDDEFFSFLPFDLSIDIMPKLIGKMKGYFIQEFLMDIGTHKSYQKALKVWKYI